LDVLAALTPEEADLCAPHPTPPATRWLLPLSAYDVPHGEHMQVQRFG
jgi:hypothetical protein